MKKLSFNHSAHWLILTLANVFFLFTACQQNTQKQSSAPNTDNSLVATTDEQPQQQPDNEVDNDWKKLELKGKVKTLTKIIYEGVEKNGKFVKNELSPEPFAITRTSFNPQGFITLIEQFNNLQMVNPFSTQKNRYNATGQLLEVITSRSGDAPTKYTYSYNKQGDRTLERMETASLSEPYDIEYHYEYTPEGKQETVVKNTGIDKIKTISYYDKNNLLVKEEQYDLQGSSIKKEVKTYNENQKLIKSVIISNNQETTLAYSYDSYGNLTSIREKSPEGTATQVYKYHYNNKGQILKEEFQLTSTYDDIFDSSYVIIYIYDAQGNKLTEAQSQPDAAPPITITEYRIEYY